MHHDCIYDWYSKRLEKRQSPDCPCCYATIEEGCEDLRVCYFPGGDDGSNRLEDVSPQDILSSFNGDTRQAMQLLALLKKLKPKLSAADHAKYDSMFEDIKLGVIPTTTQLKPLDEVYESLKEMVEHVGQWWAEEGIRVSQVEFSPIKIWSECDAHPIRPPSRECATSIESGSTSVIASRELARPNPFTREYETTASTSGSS